MDAEDRYFWFRRARTKSVEGGIKARSARFGQKWWTARWLAALGPQTTSRMARGRTYARKGQITDFAVAAGKIFGRIQGSADEPYRATLRMPPVHGEIHKSIVREFLQRPLLAAKLLNQEMPSELEEVFLRSGRPLFPDRKDLVTDCDCPDEANPCKHIAAVAYLFSLELERDPFLLLQFRGFDRSLLQTIVSPASATIEMKSEPLPLAPKEFWKAQRIPQQPETKRPADNAIFIRQLGHFPLWRGEADFLK